MSRSDLQQRMEFAREIAIEAGNVTLQFFRRDDLQVEYKQDGSPLTMADQASERILRERISERYPHDGIVGEEFGETGGTTAYRWILDPIDGTKSFICGVPLYGSMVGLELEGHALAGSIFFPALGEGMFAAKGMGAWYFHNDFPIRRARTSSQKEFGKAVLLTTCIEAYAKRQADSSFRELANKAKLVRTWGDVYGYMLVATGRADVMIDPFMNIWDAAALQPIIEEAGGIFTDWRGATRIDGGDAIASNAHLHQQVVAAFHQCPLPTSIV